MRKLMTAALLCALALGGGSEAQAQRQYFGYTGAASLDGTEVFGPIRQHGADKTATLSQIQAFSQANVTALINSTVPGIVATQFPALFAASIAALPGALTQSFTATHWGVPSGTQAKINRLADRVMIGPAVLDDGLFWASGCPGCGAGATNHTTWFELLANQSYNGGVGVFSDEPFAQVSILADPNSTPATTAVPMTALLVAAETLNGKTGSTVRGIDLTVINNSVSGQNPGAWGLYLEAHQVGTSTTNTYGVELDMRHSSTVAHWDPYATTPGVGGTVGIDLACGAGLPATGQHDCTVPLYFSANPMPWSTGILFFPGSVDATGPGGTIPAIAMPSNFAIQWYTGAATLGATLTGDGAGGLTAKGDVTLSTGLLKFTVLPAGVAAYKACFTAAGVLVASVLACP